jgi:hypothetical protein
MPDQDLTLARGMLRLRAKVRRLFVWGTVA